VVRQNLVARISAVPFPYFTRLKLGTGTAVLPVMNDVRREAKNRKIELLVLPTAQAIEMLKKQPSETNAILHVTC
jgi:hypothetical protein